LHIPSTTLVAETEHEVLEKGLEDLVAILANRIDLLQDQPEAVTVRREGLEAVAALLQFWRKRGRSDAFLSFLTPTVLSLRPYVERELEVREIEGSLTGLRLAPLEILDQVLVDAWEFFRRKNGLPLDLWLIRLADQAIARLGKPLAEASLDEQVEATDTEPRAFQRADWDEWIEQASYRETEALAELLGGAPAIDAWDDLSLGERQTHLSGLLGRLPWEQRQALLLNSVYGFNLAEIADFQGRALADVQSGIDEAIETLKQKPRQDRKRSD
jgi:DNA-directed RNA polymerase specialized sigma24 family protein